MSTTALSAWWCTRSTRSFSRSPSSGRAKISHCYSHEFILARCSERSGSLWTCLWWAPRTAGHRGFAAVYQNLTLSGCISVVTIAKDGNYLGFYTWRGEESDTATTFLAPCLDRLRSHRKTESAPGTMQMPTLRVQISIQFSTRNRNCGSCLAALQGLKTWYITRNYSRLGLI